MPGSIERRSQASYPPNFARLAPPFMKTPNRRLRGTVMAYRVFFRRYPYTPSIRLGHYDFVTREEAEEPFSRIFGEVRIEEIRDQAGEEFNAITCAAQTARFFEGG